MNTSSVFGSVYEKKNRGKKMLIDLVRNEQISG